MEEQIDFKSKSKKYWHWYKDCPFYDRDEPLKMQFYYEQEEHEYKELCQYCLAESNRKRISQPPRHIAFD